MFLLDFYNSYSFFFCFTESENYPNKYKEFSDCKWTLEGPRGTNIVLQFSNFETEKNFDTVQILGGGRTDDTAVNMASLSGSLDLTSKTFVSASNFMVIKFKTDGSVEKSGFRASWRTEAQTCGGDLIATQAPQILASPNYPRDYPGTYHHFVLKHVYYLHIL